MTHYYEDNEDRHDPLVNFEPLDEYQQILLEDFYSPESRRKIVKMAAKLFRQQYGRKPIILKIQVNWAMDNAVDRGQKWKQTERPHNLRIFAAERLLEQMVNTEYDINLDWFAVQEQLRDQAVTTPCGSHFVDRAKYQTSNII